MRISALAALIAFTVPAMAQQNIDNSPELRAVFLAHAYTFVASSCPTLRPDEQAIQAAIAATGYTPDQLSRPPLAERVSVMSDYFGGHNAEARAQHCKRLLEALGPFGTAARNLIRSR